MAFVPGSIEIAIEGRVFLPRIVFEDIDWLWPFFANSILEVLSSQQSILRFPSQPISVHFHKVKSLISMKTDFAGHLPENKATTSLDLFLFEFCRAGRIYLDNGRRLGFMRCGAFDFARLSSIIEQVEQYGDSLAPNIKDVSATHVTSKSKL